MGSPNGVRPQHQHFDAVPAKRLTISIKCRCRGLTPCRCRGLTPFHCSNIYTCRMRNLKFLIVGEFLAVWLSVIAGLALRWRMPISPWVAVSLGLLLWICGFAYTLRLRSMLQKGHQGGGRQAGRLRRGYPMVEARAAMHFGVAIGFRSWPTLGVAVACIVLNIALAFSLRRRMRRRVIYRRGF